LEIVEQNWPDYDTGMNLTARRILELNFVNGSYVIANSLGWIHSPRMANRLTVASMTTIPMSDDSYFGSVQWNRDQDTVYFYLSQAATEALGNDSSFDKKEASALLSEISKTRALNLTEIAYSQCVFNQVAELIQNRFKTSETKSLDFTLKYTGSSIWARAWWKSGPNSNSGWVQIDNIRCGWNGNRY